MHTLLQDLRQSLRALLLRPGFTIVAVLTLALGIGATTAIYTVVHAVLLAPLPYPEPEHLVVVQESNPEGGFPRFSISPLNFRDYRAMSRSFTALAARTWTSLALVPAAGNHPRHLRAQAVTWEYLQQVFGVVPRLGRGLGEQDDQPGAPPVIVLADALWRDLGADPALVGAELRVEGEPTTVVGVLPPGALPGVDAVVPLRLDYEDTHRGAHWLIAFGRLAPGVSV